MNSQRTLSGLVTGDFDELVVENDFKMSGTFTAGGIQVQGNVSCGDISCADLNASGGINAQGSLAADSLNINTFGISAQGNVTGNLINCLQVDADVANIDTVNVDTLNLADGLAIDGALTMRDPADDGISLKINQAVSGVSSAGLGNIQGGKASQYGIIIEETPSSGTYQKALVYANAFEAIIPANGGTGWLPLQVKTYNGVGGNKFKVDIDGNTTTALKLSCNSLGVDGDLATISSAGVFSGTGLNCNEISVNSDTATITSAGVITGSGLNCNEISVNSDTATITSAGIITGEKMNAPQHNITTNQGSLSFGNYSNTAIAGSTHSSKTACNNLHFNDNTNKWSQLNFGDGYQTTLTGSTYLSSPTFMTNFDLRDYTNATRSERIFRDGATYRYAMNAGDFRINDDHSYYNLSIVDSSASLRGSCRVNSTTAEIVTVMTIPQGWRVDSYKMHSYPTTAGQELDVDVYKVYTDATLSSTNLQSQAQTTNYETILTTKYTSSYNTAIMIIIHTTATSNHVRGGWLNLTWVGVSSGF